MHKMNEREGLRNIDSPEWPNVFDSYLEALGIPTQTNGSKLNAVQLIDGLVTYAVRLEYNDNGEFCFPFIFVY